MNNKEETASVNGGTRSMVVCASKMSPGCIGSSSVERKTPLKDHRRVQVRTRVYVHLSNPLASIGKDEHPAGSYFTSDKRERQPTATSYLHGL